MSSKKKRSKAPCFSKKPSYALNDIEDPIGHADEVWFPPHRRRHLDKAIEKEESDIKNRQSSSTIQPLVFSQLVVLFEIASKDANGLTKGFYITKNKEGLGTPYLDEPSNNRLLWSCCLDSTFTKGRELKSANVSKYIRSRHSYKNEKK